MDISHWHWAEAAAKFQLPSVCYPWPSVLFAQLLIHAALCRSFIVCSLCVIYSYFYGPCTSGALLLCLLSYLLGDLAALAYYESVL